MKKNLKNKLYKRLILILIVLFIVPSTYAIFSECNKVSFCDGSYNLTCNYYSDGYCPEDYGNWGPPGNDQPCKLNPYGSKCFPCDVDCGVCGAVTVSMPPNAYPDEYIHVNATIFTFNTGFSVLLFDNPTQPPISGVSCPSSNCVSTVSGEWNAKLPNNPTGVQVSGIGGTLYTYGVKVPIISLSNTVWGYGVTKPNVNIEQPPQQSTQSGTFTITTMAFSAFTPDMFTGYSGITTQSGRVIYDITGAAGEEGGEGTPSNNKLTKLKLYLYKETYPGNYEEANPDNNCATCSSDDCNLIGEWLPREPDGFDQYGIDGEYFNYLWDSSECGGDIKDFKITAKAYDGYTSDESDAPSADVYFTLDNENAPCIENCPKVSTNLLNLIISKIKVWL